MTKEEIAQWVIDNRYAKSEYEKVSDFEMYHTIVEQIEALILPVVIRQSEQLIKEKEKEVIVKEIEPNGWDYFGGAKWFY